MRLHGLPDDHLETYVGRIYDVTPEEVQRIMHEYIRPAGILVRATFRGPHLRRLPGPRGRPRFSFPRVLPLD